MPRVSATTPAQQSRDQGLARLRRLTVWAGVWAAGLAAIASLIAANTIPGRNLASQSTPTTPSAGSIGDNGGAVTAPGQQPNLNPPAQLPQPDSGGGPVVVSGSS